MTPCKADSQHSWSDPDTAPQAGIGRRSLGYWRDKRGHEVDFILARPGRDPIAIECKWQADQFDPTGILSFRQHYPKGMSLLVSHDIGRTFKKRYRGREVTFCSLQSLVDLLSSKR
jgi:hypothetical protein